MPLEFSPRWLGQVVAAFASALYPSQPGFSSLKNQLIAINHICTGERRTASQLWMIASRLPRTSSSIHAGRLLWGSCQAGADQEVERNDVNKLVKVVFVFRQEHEEKGVKKRHRETWLKICSKYCCACFMQIVSGEGCQAEWVFY